MSYILDAIKKADKKRELGSVPDVNTVHEAPPVVEPRRSGWLYGLAAVLIVNALGLGWWLLWSGTGAKTPVAQSPDKSAVAETTANTPASPPPQPQQTAKVKPPPPPPPTPAASEPAPPSPPPAVQTEVQPDGKPVDPLAAQTGVTKPPTVAPPPSTPADKASAEAEEAAAPASPVPPPAAKIEPPPAKPVAPAPASPPPAVPAGTPPAAQPVNPFLAKVEAVTKSPGPPPSPPPVPVKAPAAALVGKGDLAPPKKGTSPAPEAPAAGVVPVAEPEGPDASPEEPLVEAEEAPAEAGDADHEAAAEAGEEALAPIASSPPSKGKAKRAEKDDEDPELAKIPFFKQLPPDVQQAIPELHISFHSYSIKPSARLVSISGKILREGESYDENVKLETITVKGVVLVYKGRRFRLEV